ncbi:MAG: SH3 domain-containing protein, partial [Phycisphaerae bacterium]|nr:SH3 domain-containing protein [Phycisphaerae bacterium]
MKTRLIALLLPAVLSATNLAMAQSPSAPYPGVVTGSNVYVRSGPNMGSYPVTKLGESDQVTVVERLSDEWLAIQPVRGCYGVISAQYVQPDAAGKIGTILGNGVLVRAAGELRTRNFDNPLGKRNRGDRVRLIGRVVGTDGKIEWYVIKPPEDMRFYISARFVRSAEEPAETEEESPAAARTPAAPSEAPAAMAAPVSQELEALRAIRALEKELVTESNKPVEQRNFADILSRAEKIRLPENSRFAPIHKSLMQYIREEVALVENTRQTERQVEAVLRQAAEKRDQAIKTTAPTESPKTSDPNRLFDLEGVLSVSALYTLADPNQPRRYVVRTPDTKAIVGYVQSSKGKVRLEDFVGKSVGIRGKITYDGSISMKILEADSVTSLAQMTEKVPAERLAAERQAKPVEPEPTEPLVEEPKPTEPEPTEP